MSSLGFLARSCAGLRDARNGPASASSTDGFRVCRLLGGTPVQHSWISSVAVAFSVSFEEDYLHLLQTAGSGCVFPLRRADRSPWDPLIIMGGSCAAINPLPMSEFIDVFALGAAENLLPALLPALAEEKRPRCGGRTPSSTAPGFLSSQPCTRRKKKRRSDPNCKSWRLRDRADAYPWATFPPARSSPRAPSSPKKFLIEMSRGCPEKCRYCWATFGNGQVPLAPDGLHPRIPRKAPAR